MQSPSRGARSLGVLSWQRASTSPLHHNYPTRDIHDKPLFDAPPQMFTTQIKRARVRPKSNKAMQAQTFQTQQGAKRLDNPDSTPTCLSTQGIRNCTIFKIQRHRATTIRAHSHDTSPFPSTHEQPEGRSEDNEWLSSSLAVPLHTEAKRVLRQSSWKWH